jgi:hypothetical protein
MQTQTENKFPFMKPMKEDTPVNFFHRFILNLGFVKRAIKEAEIAAFPKAQKDVLETMQDDLDEKAERLSKEKLNDLLSNVALNRIVTMDKQKGILFIGGQKVEEGRLSNLKAEAEFFVQSDLWHLIYETPKELAQRAMFVAGENLDDMKKGRSILYTLSTQKNIIDVLKSVIAKTQPPAVPGKAP